MPMTIEIEVQDCENLTLEIIDAPVPDSVSIDDSAGVGDTDVTWSADKSARELADKVDKVEGYSLVADDEIGKLSTVEQYAQKNTVNSVAGKQGDVLLDKSDVGLSAVDNTADVDKPVSAAVAAVLDDKVDKVAGKQLSDENYTLAEKDKLSGVAVEATKNRDDILNADKVHTHTISDVTGLSERLSDIDVLIGDVDGQVAAAEQAATIATTKADEASQSAQAAAQSAAQVPAPYPFHNEANAVPIMLKRAIEDIFVDAPNRSLRLAFHTVERGGSSGWYLRLAAYLPDGARDLSVGSSGIVATYLSATNPEPSLTDGKRLQRISLTPQGTGAARVVGRVFVDIDWEAITVTTNIVAGAQSYTAAGFSGRVFSENVSTINLLSRPSLLQDLPRNPKIWAKSNTFSIARLDQVFLDVTLFGADAGKRYGFGPISYNAAPGRIIFWLSELLADGSLGDRVALFDRTGGHASPSLEGEIETIFMAPYLASGVSASVTVNWSALPDNSPNSGSDFFYASPPASESELSVFGTSADAGPAVLGHNVIDFQIEGVNARLTTSDGYGSDGPDTLMLLIHGNGGSYSYTPSESFKAWARANKVSYACIQGQDFTAAPYGSAASGWGGDIQRTRQVKLYEHLMKNYDFHSSVVLAGASMGGLAMGQLAYYRPFPVKFCLGIGPVPNLSHIFTAGGENRKSPIRNAFGMAADGSQDALLEDFIQGADWFDMGMTEGASPRKMGFPRMYLYAGDGDTTYAVDFGGETYYSETRDAIRRAGGFCTLTIVAGVPHADSSIWDRALSDGVMEREDF